jgi:putative hydrolase of the HAD superfamily
MRAITFDVGGTLIEPCPSVGHIYSEVAARHGVGGLEPELLNRRFDEAWQAMKNFNYTREGWAQIVEYTFAGLTDISPARTFFPDLYARFAEPEAWRIFDDVLPTLEALRARGLILGVISNWDERLRPLLRRLHLDHYFAVTIISCEAGAAKPDRAIFARAVEQLGVAPGAILHIGDSLEADVRGAQAAGFAAIRLCRRARPAALTKAPVFVTSLREIVPSVEPLNR